MDKTTLLSETQITKLKTKFEVLTFRNDFQFVYEKQIPNAAIILIEGSIELTRKKKKNTVMPGHMIAMNYLLKGNSANHGVLIKAQSKVILLGKSDLKTIMEYQDFHRP